ncbi:MAG TPA: EAL domain-containing protein [Acidobacteriaceae bacterium]|nr:EAL domain-containing protein [Acidobacteriaceae bacterium]
MTGKTQTLSLEGPPPQCAVAPMRLLGRQPIVHADGRLFGYELLSRSGNPDAFTGDPEQATREVVDQWLMLIPEANEGQAFVNCTRDALVEGTCTLLPPENTVLEILETIEPDAALISSLRSLRGQGYRFALDDFAPLRSRESLMEFADFIKIDFLASDGCARKEIYAMAAGTKARLLAEKIETKEEMLIAQAEGCSLFQGYFFSRPHIVSSRALPQNHVAWLRLLTALNRTPTDLGEIEKLVLADAALCYRILRLANSALHFHARAVTSVREALIMVGEDAVRRLVTVAMAGVIAGDRAPTVVNMALVRARFCELLAPELGESNAQLYLLGMLSLLDVLLEMPMQRILTALPIDAEMKDALLGSPGPFSRALELARCLEACEWPHCEDLRKALRLEEHSVAAHYVEALRWTSQALQA